MERGKYCVGFQFSAEGRRGLSDLFLVVEENGERWCELEKPTMSVGSFVGTPRCCILVQVGESREKSGSLRR